MEKINLTVGFVTACDPKDKKSWSGTLYRMLMALDQEFSKTVIFGPVKFPKYLKLILHIINFFHNFFFGKKYNMVHNNIRSKYYNLILKKKLRNEKVDVIFAPVASTEIAYLQTNIPICYLSDTSFNQIKDYYGSYSNISNLSIQESNLIEQKAIQNSTSQIYSSDWAADYAKSFYKAKNVYVVKFGANVDKIPNEFDIIKFKRSTIKLLFLGVDWIRKGGKIVIETIDLLSQNGYDFHLTICGCDPIINNPHITVIPFLDKNKNDDMITFTNLLYESHILFVPTRADCTPIVFCEANAYGIPVVTTDTGGVSSIIENGINGFTLHFNAKANEYAETIGYLLENRTKLEEMSKMCLFKYNNELNWSSWGHKVREILLLTINNQWQSKL